MTVGKVSLAWAWIWNISPGLKLNVETNIKNCQIDTTSNVQDGSPCMACCVMLRLTAALCSTTSVWQNRSRLFLWVPYMCFAKVNDAVSGFETHFESLDFQRKETCHICVTESACHACLWNVMVHSTWCMESGEWFWVCDMEWGTHGTLGARHMVLYIWTQHYVHMMCLCTYAL